MVSAVLYLHPSTRFATSLPQQGLHAACVQGDPLPAAGSAQAAVEALDGAVGHGQELRASPSMPVRERAAPLDGTFCSVYVRNLGPAARPFVCLVHKAWTSCK